ncbi:MAG: T9SS type A sorting domain-containing protein [Sphingobacteriaceae bacterium]|nr:T9SS type A sorting domain-containing protein [Sphingobacteriaceae bacterium]
MNKKIKILSLTNALLLVSFANLKAQANLVPNFSFETYTNCPNSEDQVEYSTGWSKYSTASATPDYYNACSSFSSFGVPKNVYCNQPARRNCNAYIGLVTYWSPVSNAREHVGIQLSQPLIPGQKYFISFHVVMGEYSLGGNQYGMPSNNIGLRFTMVQHNSANPTPIDNFSHLHSPSVIIDSVNWQRISGSFIADNNYNYLVLGNFYDDANTTVTNYTCPTCSNLGSYYLVDDICVSTDSLLCNNGINALPCVTSINELSLNDRISVAPNPVIDVIYISLRNSVKVRWTLLDLVGNKVLTGEIDSSITNSVDLHDLASGIYILTVIENSNYSRIVKKIIKK